MNKRYIDTQLTPPGNKVRVVETTAAIQELVQKLGQQMPENELFKQLQSALDEIWRSFHPFFPIPIRLKKKKNVPSS